MRWLLLLALAGCFTQTREVEIPGSVHVDPETFVGPVIGVALNVTESYGTLHVDASLTRFCYREVKQLIEHHEETEGGVFIRGIPVGATSDEDLGFEDRMVSVQKTDCSIPAPATQIGVELPSGAVVRGVTDTRGLAHIQIPATEPASGVAIVRASGAAIVRIAYARGR